VRDAERQGVRVAERERSPGPSVPFEPPDTLVISELPALRAISDPLRMRILEELCPRERSVGELAAIVGSTRHRLYYHVRMLEKLGLIRETSQRTVSGAVERLYRASARTFVVSAEISPALLAGSIASVFGQTLREVEAAVGRQLGEEKREDPQVTVLRAIAPLDPDRHREFVRRFKALVQEMEQDPDQPGDVTRFGLLIAMAPVLEEES